MKATPRLLAIAAAGLYAVQAHAGTASFDVENPQIGTRTPFSMTAGGLTTAFAGPPHIASGAFGVSPNFPSPTGFAYRLTADNLLSVGMAFGAVAAASNAIDIRVDNLQVATTTPMPKRSPAWLVAAGLLLIAVIRLRR